MPEDIEARTLASEHRDFVDWRRGRSRYALWAIALPELEPALAGLRRHLRDYLLPGYARQAHVTVRVCGFPGEDTGAGDDLTPAALAVQVRALRAARIAPFALTIGAPDTFSAAAYFSIGDVQLGLKHLRQALTETGNNGQGDAGDLGFVPHLTVGLYRAPFPISQVMQRLRSYPAAGDTPVPITVDRLALMSYEAAVITGTLTRVGEFDLARQTWRVVDAAAFAEMFERSKKRPTRRRDPAPG